MYKRYERDNRKDSTNLKTTEQYKTILRCGTALNDTTYYPWIDGWGIDIGKQGEEIKEQFDNGMSIPFNVAQELREYPIQLELSTDKEYFLPTIQQRTELIAIIDDDERSYRKNVKYKAYD
jgi:hypothetical protein